MKTGEWGAPDGISAFIRTDTRKLALFCLLSSSPPLSLSPCSSVCMPCKDKDKRLLARTNSHQNLNILAPYSQTSSLQTSETISFSCSSHSILVFCYGSLNWLNIQFFSSFSRLFWIVRAPWNSIWIWGSMFPFL